MEKKGVIKGLIKAVQSGDHVIIHKSSKTGPAKEIPVFLASVMAPKIGSSNRQEEPFGFEAREFLRDKIIGKKCDFNPEYSYGGREYGTLIVNGENLNVAIVKAGLAKVLEKKGNMAASSNYDELIAIQNELKGKKTGLWSSDPSYLEKHTRNVTYFSDAGFSGSRYFEESKGIDKPLEAIVEYVFSASFVSVYVHKFSAVVKLSMNHLFTPSNADKSILSDGKAFTEKFILHRTIGVKFEKVEEGGTLVGRIFHPAGDIAYEIVKNGFSKLNVPKTTDFDAEYFKTLKEAQLVAQSKQLRIWKDFKQEEKKQQKASTTDFTGKVVEIHSGDSMTVQRESDLQNIRVFMATVKAPVMISKETGDPEPYAWESKEALRKAVIGKKVKVFMEFSKTVPGKPGEKDRNMDFASVFNTKNNKNVATILLEKGLLKTNVTKSGDNASKFLEDLLGAEKKAQDAKIGLFSNQQAPIRIYNDLVNNAKKSKDFEAIIMKRQNRKLNGVVEYCFSGMRYKVRLDSENTAIAFSLQGVKTMANDKNQPQLLEFANGARAFAQDTLLQKDVIVEPDFTDKNGNFFGTLWYKAKKDFAAELVGEGLAQVHLMGSKIPYNIDELQTAEAKAKVQQIGIWSKGLKLASGSSPKKVQKMERIQVEMTDIKDATRFHVRILGESQYNKIDAELDKFSPLNADDLEKPIKRGTLCAARFTVDNRWYRASVLRTIGKGQIEVEFVDFGNIEVIDGNDLKKLPASLLQYEPQAKLCHLAYIKVPPLEKDFGTEAGKLVQKMALEKISEAIVVDQYGSTLSIILFEKGEKDWNNSVNALLVADGLASMAHLEEDDQSIPQEVNEWYDFEEEAREKQLKIWEYGGAGGDSDDN